jgi:hypothetical protein
MGWRDRVKKSFGDFEDIEHRGRNVKSDKNNNKKGSQVIFNGYPHNPQNPQNPEKETGGKVGSKKEPDTPRAVKIGNSEDKSICGNSANKLPTPAQNIPAPEPAGMGAEYESLWHRAWKLADFIDNPAEAPLAERRARLPELDDLRERMAAIEKAGVVSHGTPAPDPAGTWTPWESIGTTRDRSPDTCPAMCKRSGKCYARAYFKGKAGKAAECMPDDCQWRAGQ